MNKLIVHVSEVDISRESGMGRVEWYWKEAFEKAGYTFLHIGPAETGLLRHPSLFPSNAYNQYKKLHVHPAAFIVHEPAAAPFVNTGIPCFIESHGVERRYWDAKLRASIPGEEHVSLKTKLLFPLWRLRGCDKGLQKADKLLLINNEDSDYVQARYERTREDIFIFKNGINSDALTVAPSERKDAFTLLFNGSWIARKGIYTLITAAELLYKRQISIQYVLAGTGLDPERVLHDWPEYLTASVRVISRFAATEELTLLAGCDLFLLPSFFEGQPLSLLQAMAAGRCCITTNCCGQKDIINHRQNGLLFEPGDAVTLAELIEQCILDKELVRELGKEARISVENRTWENSANSIVDFITANM